MNSNRLALSILTLPDELLQRIKFSYNEGNKVLIMEA